jgi:hypothetical protein
MYGTVPLLPCYCLRFLHICFYICYVLWFSRISTSNLKILFVALVVCNSFLQMFLYKFSVPTAMEITVN